RRSGDRHDQSPAREGLLHAGAGCRDGRPSSLRDHRIPGRRWFRPLGPIMPKQRTIRVATDVGGTFTDLVYFATDPATGRQVVRTAKVDTTPPDYEKGVLDVLAKSGIDAADIAFFAHGTTVVINAF